MSAYACMHLSALVLMILSREDAKSQSGIIVMIEAVGNDGVVSNPPFLMIRMCSEHGLMYMLPEMPFSSLQSQEKA